MQIEETVLDQIRSRPRFKIITEMFTLFILLIAICQGIAGFFTMHLFSILGNKVAFKLRSDLFKKILRMHIGWFDEEKYTSSKLGNILSEDARIVNQVIESVIGIVLQTIGAIIFSVVIGMISSWRTGLTISILKLI